MTGKGDSLAFCDELYSNFKQLESLKAETAPSNSLSKSLCNSSSLMAKLNTLQWMFLNCFFVLVQSEMDCAMALTGVSGITSSVLTSLCVAVIWFCKRVQGQVWANHMEQIVQLLLLSPLCVTPCIFFFLWPYLKQHLMFPGFLNKRSKNKVKATVCHHRCRGSVF